MRLSYAYAVAGWQPVKLSPTATMMFVLPHTVEPVFGIIKEVMGFRQFLLRGLERVEAERQLVTLAHNLKRLWKLNQATS